MRPGLIHRQKTCAACGGPLPEPGPDSHTNVEPLIDDIVRYVAVHWGCSTHPSKGGDGAAQTGPGA